MTLAGLALGTLGMRGEGLAPMTAALGKLRLPLFLMAVLTLAALIYLFVPITTFLTSPGELSIHLDFLFTRNMRDAMVMVYLALALYMLAFSERLRTALTLAAIAAAVLSLIYSYALPFGYPMMAGLTFEQVPASPLERVPRLLTDLAVVALVAFGLRWVLVRFGPGSLIAAAVIVNLSLGTAAGVGIFRDRVGEAGGPGSAAQLAEQPLKFSRTQPNVLIVFLDRFMGSYVESTLQSDPALADRLSGFTWYPRTLAAGENSIAGVHPMLGGYDYLPVAMNARNLPLRDLSVEAFAILPRNFAAKGFRVNVVNPNGLGFTMNGDCSYLEFDRVHCSHIPVSVSKHTAQQMNFPLNDLATANYADLLVLLGAMRAAPYATKEVVLRRGPWQPFLDHSAGTTFREWAELRALPALTDSSSIEPNMNFVSNILAHEPYYMGEDCLPRRERFILPPEEFRRRGHASMFSLQHANAARCVLLVRGRLPGVPQGAGRLRQHAHHHRLRPRHRRADRGSFRACPGRRHAVLWVCAHALGAAGETARRQRAAADVGDLHAQCRGAAHRLRGDRRLRESLSGKQADRHPGPRRSVLRVAGALAVQPPEPAFLRHRGTAGAGGQESLRRAWLEGDQVAQ